MAVEVLWLLISLLGAWSCGCCSGFCLLQVVVLCVGGYLAVVASIWWG
jgi:hypothetical protein